MATSKPDLTRVWANAAPGGNVIDPDTTQPGRYNSGWVVEAPAMENFNFLQKSFTQGLAHFNEQGIGVWDAATTYPVDGLVKGSVGKVYKALVEQSNNDPTTDSGINWLCLDGDSSSVEVVVDATETTLATILSPNISYNSLLTLKYIGMTTTGLSSFSGEVLISIGRKAGVATQVTIGSITELVVNTSGTETITPTVVAITGTQAKDTADATTESLLLRITQDNSNSDTTTIAWEVTQFGTNLDTSSGLPYLSITPI